MPEAPLEAQSWVGALKPHMTSRGREARELARVRGVCLRASEGRRVELGGEKKKNSEGNIKK